MGRLSIALSCTIISGLGIRGRIIIVGFLMPSLCVCMFIVSTATIAIGSGWTLFVYCYEDKIVLLVNND